MDNLVKWHFNLIRSRFVMKIKKNISHLLQMNRGEREQKSILRMKRTIGWPENRCERRLISFTAKNTLMWAKKLGIAGTYSSIPTMKLIIQRSIPCMHNQPTTKIVFYIKRSDLDLEYCKSLKNRWQKRTEPIWIESLGFYNFTRFWVKNGFEVEKALTNNKANEFLAKQFIILHDRCSLDFS